MSASNPSVPPVQLRDLLDGWQLGRINSIRPYEGGSSGSNKSMVEATEGRFLLKGRPLKALSAEQLEFMRVVMAGCADAKLPVPDLRPKANGLRHVEYQGLVWELQSWMSGRGGRRGNEDASASGLALAMFHRATRSRQISNPKSCPHRHHFDRFIKRAIENVPTAELTLRSLGNLATVARAKVEERGISNHPKQTLHGDWHPRNLRFNEQGRVCGILDFDGVRVDAVATELANAVLQVSLRRSRKIPAKKWPAGIKHQAGQRLITAWRSRIGKAPPAETWGMLPWLMIEAVAGETILPIAIHGRVVGIDTLAWVEAGIRNAEWIRERSRALGEALVPEG